MNPSQIPTGEWLRPTTSETLLDGFYCPIYLEPMVGSGERLCIAVVAATPEGFLVAPSPGLERLECFYDGDANFLLDLAGEVRFDLETTFANDSFWRKWQVGTSLTDHWTPPFDGFHVGEAVWAMGKDASEIADAGLMMCSSLVAKMKTNTRRQLLTRPRLISEVKGHVLARHTWGDLFDVSFPFYGDLRYDFVGHRLATHIGIIMPDELNESVDATKAGILDLLSLRAKGEGALASQLHDRQIEHFCVLLHTESARAKKDAQIEQSVVETQLLKQMGNENSVQVIPCTSSEDVAQRLMQLEAA